MRLHGCNGTTRRPLFQSTHSLRSATVPRAAENIVSRVSIHALLAECDRVRHSFPRTICGFNPRTPCGVRLTRTTWQRFYARFQSTHSLRSATSGRSASFPPCVVSIHALLAECDMSSTAPSPEPSGFNPRTPCGVRRCCFLSASPSCQFQSTHSLRSATVPGGFNLQSIPSFNPRTPCGVRRAVDVHSPDYYEVSIHALLAECDPLMNVI